MAAHAAYMEGLTTHISYFPVNPDLVLGAIIGTMLWESKPRRIKS
jgi:hypothetical protein